jgi:hypothetical protein
MRQGHGSFGSRLRCLWRGRHNPARHPLGGFRCRDCRRVGADLVQMGFEDAYVPALRRTFSRDRGSTPEGV